MSLFSRILLLPVLLLCAACGFEPAYVPGGVGTELQNAVQVAEPRNRQSFLVVQRLEERLGRPAPARFNLSINVRARAVGLGISAEGNTNRFNLIGTAGYVLSDRATGTSLSSGAVNNFTGYSVTDSTVSALAARRDAEERLMIMLADQVVARLLAADLTE